MQINRIVTEKVEYICDTCGKVFNEPCACRKCEEQHLQEVGKCYKVVRVQFSVDCWGGYDRDYDDMGTFNSKVDAVRYCNRFRPTNDVRYYVEEV